MSSKSYIAICGSGLVGYDPLARSTWSGSSYYFFSQFQGRGLLKRGFGFEVPSLQRHFYMARNFHWNRLKWRKHYYMDPGYRGALTVECRRRFRGEDLEHNLFQLGAMFNAREAAEGKAECYSYHDGSVAESLRSPYAPKNLSSRRIDGALAFERRVYHDMTRVFTCSEYLRQSLIRDFDLSPDKVVAIGAGVNLEAFPSAVPNKRYDTATLLFIGSDFSRKGGWDLLKAFQIVRTRIKNATLHIVGPRQLQLGADHPGVVCHGFLSKSQPADAAKLAQLFREATLFVLPSLYEPFGIAPLEAMSHEIPCLVSGAWALRENVTPGITGGHTPPGDAEAMALKLTEMMSDPPALERMGKNGREMVLRKFTWQRVVDNCLGSIAAERARPAPARTTASSLAGVRAENCAVES